MTVTTGLELTMEDIQQPVPDFFDHEPSKAEKIEMRKASKSPSEWLRLLARDWVAENISLAEGTDALFLKYKSYLKGKLSSQLLCRLSIQDQVKDGDSNSRPIDFWKILGIEDEFDKSYIVAQIERFCALYSIRGVLVDEDFLDSSLDATTAVAAAAAGLSVPPSHTAVPVSTNYFSGPNGMDANAATVAAHAAAVAAADLHDKLNQKSSTELIKNTNNVKEIDLGLGSHQIIKRDQQKLTTTERREARQREREAANVRKAADKAAREATREERRQKKALLRQQREHFLKEQKDAALRRAADLVRSNRVPIEITRGAAAAQAAANAAVAMMRVPTFPTDQDGSANKKPRSAIVVSTASDLHQIVTHAKNLWTKYNAIAKEHNQKVNWITVAKELGIHVKVREKYARMHARALQRGFDFEKCGHYKIKDHHHIFLEPTLSEQKSKMPIQSQDPNRTVLINIKKHESSSVTAISDDQVKAAVDAAIKTVPVTADITHIPAVASEEAISDPSFNVAAAVALTAAPESITKTGETGAHEI